MAQPARRFAFLLARDMGCTVAELGRRMSAREFQEWQVMYAHEQLHPGAGRMRHAQVLAATYQGPSTRRDRKNWSAADFMSPDPWAPVAPVVRAPMSGAQLKSFAGRVNARRSRH